MKKEGLLHGLIAAPFTPFDSAGNIDLKTIPTLVQLYLQNGVSGAFVAGSTGEGVSLSLAEKLELLKHWADSKSGGLKTIFMIGGNCIKDMQTLALAAQEHRYDAISMVSPFYFKPRNLNQLVDFCAEVLTPVPEMPFYYYHIPVLTGVNFNMHEYVRLAEARIPAFQGVKYTAPQLMDFHQCCLYGDGRYEMLWGTDEALLSSLTMGASGAVGSTYNYMAPLYHKIMSSVKDGNLTEAEKYQRSSIKVVELLVKYGGLATGKAIMEIIGVNCGDPRSPNAALGDENKKSLLRELTELGFFQFCSKLT